ncbi:MAG: nucleotidyltransferase [Planctomycetaceae bacterium]|nr:hypothetical protein [Planctomycetales bacterium]MCB9924335.1 nucleotidyltransferase [Planctomycetaceae bacterium]
MATQQQFRDFLSDIEPSATTKSNAKSRHTELRDFLANDTEFKKLHVQTFLSGSYRRDTAIRPRKLGGVIARPDVDIIVETNHTLADDPKDVIDAVFYAIQRLKNQKESYTSLRRQARSIGVETSTVDMDVVPIIAPDGMDGTLYIANRKHESSLDKWLVTNPPGHTKWTVDINAASGGRFKPLVKLMKWWRRQNPTLSKRPKGFVIECIVAECFDPDETDYEKLFLGTLDSIVSRYEAFVSAGLVPYIADPSVPGNYVTTGLTFDAFEGFYKKVKAHAEIGEKILAETDADEELKLWKSIFGDRFPAAGMSTKAAGLLPEAACVSPFVFPDRPIAPTKPGGFA